MSTTLNAIEAPVTIKAYLMCAFASFGGIFFGYDSGYINGVLGAREFINAIAGEGAERVSGPNTSLIVSILSAGTFFGALAAGDLADMIGRRLTIIAGCVVYLAGVVIQMFAAEGLGVIVAGRVIAGVGVGFVSAIIILYMSEICPRKIRGALVSGYQFCITIGIMLASIINNFTSDRTDSGAYRIPIGIQFAWGLILGGGLLFLPDSPRYYVKKNNIPKARAALASVRGQPEDSHFVDAELAEIIANAEYERSLMPSDTWFGQWAACFSGSVFRSSSNLRRTILGATLQMMQQWTGVNFIFYYSTQFLQSTGAISDPFLITMIFTIVNVCSTPVSFYTVEKFGRRKLLVVGAAAMALCQFIVAIVGVTVGFNKLTTNAAGESVAQNIGAVNAQVAFIAIFIFFFASTWGPGAWVLIGEIFPLPIRSRGVALSTASNWLWNTIIAVITPYMTDADKGNLRSSVFFIWGGLCTAAFVWAYLFVPETKGLTLEQVDQMFAETTPRKSSRWVPSGTYVQGTTQGHITEVKSHDHKLEQGNHIA